MRFASEFLWFPYEFECGDDFMIFCHYEISLWDFKLFVAHLFLIHVSQKSPAWNASKSIRTFDIALLDVTWAHALVVRGFGRGFRLVARRWFKGMHDSEFGRKGLMEYVEKGRHAFWPLWDFFMRSHAFGCKTKDADKGEGVDGIYVEKGR